LLSLIWARFYISKYPINFTSHKTCDTKITENYEAVVSCHDLATGLNLSRINILWSAKGWWGCDSIL